VAVRFVMESLYNHTTKDARGSASVL